MTTPIYDALAAETGLLLEARDDRAVLLGGQPVNAVAQVGAQRVGDLRHDRTGTGRGVGEGDPHVGVQHLLRQRAVHQSRGDHGSRVGAGSGSYDDLLRTCMRWVNVD